MAAAAGLLQFYWMNEAELRQLVEAHPGRVNERDSEGLKPLAAAASRREGLSLVVWLLDEKVADVNASMANRMSALHCAKTLDILNALLDRGGDPTRVYFRGWSALIHQVLNGTAKVARLLPSICKTRKATQLFITPAASTEEQMQKQPSMSTFFSKPARTQSSTRILFH